MVDVFGLRGGLHPISFSHHPRVGVVALIVLVGVVLYQNQRNG